MTPLTRVVRTHLGLRFVDNNPRSVLGVGRLFGRFDALESEVAILGVERCTVP